MFLRNSWYLACFAQDIKAGSVLPLKILDQKVVVYATSDGRIVALKDRCPHRGAPLSLGELDGDDLRCLYHGLKYNSDGICVEIPGQEKVSGKICVRTFPAVSRERCIWIWMGEAALVDEKLIPTLFPHSAVEWNLREGWMDFKANYQLINDNLTDFSHVSYVHRASFGASAAFAVDPPNITAIDRGLRFERWLVDGFSSDSPLAETVGKESISGTAIWQSYDYLAPGVLILTVERYSHDQVPPDRGKPTGIPQSHFRQAQAVTPLDELSTRYFYMNAIPDGPGSDALNDNMMKVFTAAFQEDLAMIEAQQVVLTEDLERPVFFIKADEGPSRMRRIIERLVSADPSAQSALEPTNVA